MGFTRVTMYSQLILAALSVGCTFIGNTGAHPVDEAPSKVRTAKTMKTTWLNYSYVTSGFNLCNDATGVCRSLGHWVFTAAPENVTDSLVAGAAFSVDDGPFLPSKRGNFEAHFVNGQCSNTSDAASCVFYEDKRNAQVWNIGYDVIQQ